MWNPLLDRPMRERFLLLPMTRSTPWLMAKSCASHRCEGLAAMKRETIDGPDQGVRALLEKDLPPEVLRQEGRRGTVARAGVIDRLSPSIGFEAAFGFTCSSRPG